MEINSTYALKGNAAPLPDAAAGRRLPIREPGQGEHVEMHGLNRSEDQGPAVEESLRQQQQERMLIQRREVPLEERMKQVLSAEDIKMILYLASGIQPTDPTVQTGQNVNVTA